MVPVSTRDPAITTAPTEHTRREPQRSASGPTSGMKAP